MARRRQGAFCVRGHPAGWRSSKPSWQPAAGGCLDASNLAAAVHPTPHDIWPLPWAHVPSNQWLRVECDLWRVLAAALVPVPRENCHWKLHPLQRAPGPWLSGSRYSGVSTRYCSSSWSCVGQPPTADHSVHNSHSRLAARCPPSIQCIQCSQPVVATATGWAGECRVSLG